MKFCVKVEVHSPDGVRLWWTHSAEAKRLVTSGSATRQDKRVIVLSETQDKECGRTHTGQCYIRWESPVAGKPAIPMHKRIWPEDVHFFRSAVLDNLSITV